MESYISLDPDPQPLPDHSLLSSSNFNPYLEDDDPENFNDDYSLNTETKPEEDVIILWKYPIRITKKVYSLWPILTAIVAYLLFVSIMPSFNKFLLSDDIFPFPLTASFLQMSFATLVVLLFLIGEKIISKYIQKKPKNNHSWIFGPHFLFKLVVFLIPGILFGLMICLSNTGLQLVNIEAHVILRSSAIVWTVFFAWLIVYEIPTWGIIICCVGLIVGTVLIIIPSKLGGNITFLACFIHILSDISGALSVVTLRKALNYLDESPRIKYINPLEVVVYNKGIGSIVILIGSLILEVDNGWNTLDLRNTWIIVLGIGITIGFQVSMVSVIFLTSATTFGVANEFANVPSFFMGCILCYYAFVPCNQQYEMNTLHIIGSIIALISVIGYSMLRFFYRSKRIKP